MYNVVKVKLLIGFIDFDKVEWNLKIRNSTQFAKF